MSHCQYCVFLKNYVVLCKTMCRGCHYLAEGHTVALFIW